MSLHEDLIGAHPSTPHEFARWMDSLDIEPTDAIKVIPRCDRTVEKINKNKNQELNFL